MSPGHNPFLPLLRIISTRIFARWMFPHYDLSCHIPEYTTYSTQLSLWRKRQGQQSKTICLSPSYISGVMMLKVLIIHSPWSPHDKCNPPSIRSATSVLLKHHRDERASDFGKIGPWLRVGLSSSFSILLNVLALSIYYRLISN